MAPGPLLVLLLGTALSSCGLDLETPTLFRGDPGAAFGASVAQFGTGDDGWLLVGAPLERGDSDTGAVYGCGFRSGTCRKLPLTGPPGAVNSSLGLALAAGDDAALVCGPTSPQVCGVNVHLNGFCVQLDSALRPVRSLPEKFPECPKPSLDIAFLVDGSGSIAPSDFETMKTFIAEVMRRFRHADAQFSLTQFSDKIQTHFDFWAFRNFPDPAQLLWNVRQLRGSTHTATAIRTVLQEMFVAGRGARAGARRILVVVTDGQKFGDSLEYSDVIPLAKAMAVTRYAIGVGRAFQSSQARQELQAVASSPAHVFRVDTFGALEGIQSELQEKIFAIEGTHSALSSSFQLEMAQEGFSAALTPAGPALGAVGAFDWSGGVLVHGGGGAATFLNGSGPHLGTPGGHLGTPGGHLGTPGAHLDGAGDMRDAYLGYSAVAVRWGHTWGLALGAPRWGHLGRVIVLRSGHSWTLQAQATGRQVGSYFGASLLALEPGPGEPGPGEPRPGEPGPGKPRPGEPGPGEPGPGEPLRILVGAPLFYGGGSGGRVELCELQGSHLRCHLSLRGSPGQPLGRFGASLAHLGDLDGDRWPEVAVGAPLEDDGSGAVYLFRGTPGGVSAEGGQRIPGSRFPSQPKFFGQSLSGGRDLSGDHLPDLAVGAWGQVLLLRSPPLLQVRLSLTFEPQVIPAAVSECPEGGEEPRAHLARARLCFTCAKRSRDTFGSELSLSLRFRAELDPGRLRSRGIFASGTFQNGSLRMGEGRSCRSLEIFSKGCPQDTLTPLTLRVTLSGLGEPLEAAGGLRPQLGPDSDTAVTASLPFEHDCGPDNSCQDELHVGLKLEGPGVLVVGDGDALGVTVTVTNRGESSFGPAVALGHPEGLSYRKVEVIQAPRRSVSVRCHSEAPEGRGRLTLCQVQPPVLRAGAQVLFRVTLDVPPQVELGDSLEVTAEVTSSNPGVPGSGGRSQRATIPVRYQVFLVLASSPDSTRYLNVTSGSAPPPPAPVTHRYQVKVLGGRGLEVNVTFWVPTHLGQVRLWEELEVTPEQVFLT
ncbi:PREDICTED: integrin alpha-X-like [Pseudopodoces humilis]|uniref:integrin alpha-X-like n=1 Tax=Pseudopodoces humilis TaxID=181119 RepID=UPI0006B6FB40|nr:PREDICTED: integrin alpha-X-like [Pseudopodoces humilis]